MKRPIRWTAGLLLLLLLIPYAVPVRAAEPSSEITFNAATIRDMDPEAAAAAVRQAMAARRERIQIRWHFNLWFSTEEAAGAWMTDIQNWHNANAERIPLLALEHTGVPTEGDYLKYQLRSYDAAIGLEADESGADYILIYRYAYLTSAEEEALLAAQLGAVLGSMNPGALTEAEKAKAIYDWITSHVAYDTSHLYDETYRLQFTAYGAVTQGAAVCQGFAALFYRMALAAGLDARVVAGTGYAEGISGPHAWNIVRIGGLWYSLDCTWDAGSVPHSWFLRGQGEFDRTHVPDADFNSASFQASHPIAPQDYASSFPASELPAGPASGEGTILVPTGTAFPEDAGDAEPLIPSVPDLPSVPGSPDASDSSAASETVPLPFTDVTARSPAYDDIRYVYENGLMLGVSGTTFDPYAPLTRGMLATILWRMEGTPAVRYAGTFADDVPADAWFADGVEWAAAQGIVLGYGGQRFGPEDSVTREQLAAILNRYADRKGYAAEGEDYLAADADSVSDWAAENVSWAASNGILQADGIGRLRPTEAATRGEIAHAIRAFRENAAK